jgi:hypothetical protein
VALNAGRWYNVYMITILCTNCKKEMKKFPSMIPKSGKAYCSLSCSTSYRNKYEFNPSHTRDLSGENNPMYGKGYLLAGENNPMYGRKGKNCPAWKGGRHKRNDGYIRINVDGRRVLEHRKILLDFGIDLEGKIVHHKDQNKSNNDILNLEVITQSEHINIHREDLRK